MPPAPCSTGSTMTAAISSACCSNSGRGLAPATPAAPGRRRRGRARRRPRREDVRGHHAAVHRVHAALGVAHAHRREGVAVVAAADGEHPCGSGRRPRGPARPSSSRPRPTPSRSRRGRRAPARPAPGRPAAAPSSTAGAWVSPPNITWHIRASWSRGRGVELRHGVPVDRAPPRRHRVDDLDRCAVARSRRRTRCGLDQVRGGGRGHRGVRMPQVSRSKSIRFMPRQTVPPHRPAATRVRIRRR